jgi:hypothetical protein
MSASQQSTGAPMEEAAPVKVPIIGARGRGARLCASSWPMWPLRWPVCLLRSAARRGAACGADGQRACACVCVCVCVRVCCVLLRAAVEVRLRPESTARVADVEAEVLKCAALRRPASRHGASALRAHAAEFFSRREANNSRRRVRKTGCSSRRTCRTRTARWRCRWTSTPSWPRTWRRCTSWTQARALRPKRKKEKGGGTRKSSRGGEKAAAAQRGTWRSHARAALRSSPHAAAAQTPSARPQRRK